jgi:hypothetical protein
MDTLEEILRALGRIEGKLAGISKLSDWVSTIAGGPSSEAARYRACALRTAPTVQTFKPSGGRDDFKHRLGDS